MFAEFNAEDKFLCASYCYRVYPHRAVDDLSMIVASLVLLSNKAKEILDREFGILNTTYHLSEIAHGASTGAAIYGSSCLVRIDIEDEKKRLLVLNRPHVREEDGNLILLLEEDEKRVESGKWHRIDYSYSLRSIINTLAQYDEIEKNMFSSLPPTTGDVLKLRELDYLILDQLQSYPEVLIHDERDKNKACSELLRVGRNAASLATQISAGLRKIYPELDSEDFPLSEILQSLDEIDEQVKSGLMDAGQGFQCLLLHLFRNPRNETL